MDFTSLIAQWPLWLFIFFCSVTAFQVFYYLFFFTRVAFFKKKAVVDTIEPHAVSVIVCARDEAHHLEAHLPSILTQDYPSTHEVIVVNDNSFDDTRYFLEELHRIFPQLQPINLIQEAKHIPGKKYPLSIGIKSSKHEIMLLTDADCKPASSNWIALMQAAYRNGIEIVLGYGAYEKRPGLLNVLVRFETFITALQYLSYALAGIPYMGVGRNLSYRKALFFKEKGFSSMHHIPGGDDDLFINKVATKANTAVVLDPNAFTHSIPPANFGQWWRQKNRHYTTARYYKAIHKILLGAFALSHFAFYPLLVATCIWYDWQWALGLFAGRLLIQGAIWGKAMYRLGEKDLLPWFWLLDIWQWFYYIIFSFSLVKKPRSNWK